MLDTLTHKNLRDFGPRYTHTYGWLLQDGAKKLVYISNVRNDRLCFSTVDHDDCHVKIDAGVMFEFIPINHGWFNAKDGKAWYMTRVPARQWKRGISDSNTRISPISDPFYSNNIDLAILSNIFHDDFKHFNYDSVVGGQQAWSKHFCRGLNDEIYFYNRQVGRFKDNEITLQDNLVYQELLDLIRRRGWNMKVLVEGDNSAN